MKKRILFFTTSLGVGGAETIIKDYCLELNKDIFEITILVLDYYKNTQIERRLCESGIKLVYIDKKPSLFCKITNKLFRIIRVRSFFEKNKFDVIHTHLDVNRFLLLSIKRIHSSKLFHTIHAPIKISFVGSHRKKIEKKATDKLIRKHRMVLICLHQQMLEEANAMFSTNSSVIIHNAINVSHFLNNKLSKIEAKERINISKDCYLIGHIGRFTPSKNHLFLIDVFEQLNKRRDDAVLLLVGDGAIKESIQIEVFKRHLEEKVVFLGIREDIPEILSAMDWFVFPSLYESFGISLLEAQVIGVPSITSDRVPECVIISENVIVQKNYEAKRWAEFIVTNQNTAIVHEKEFEKFDIRYVIKEIEQLYLK